MAATPEWTGEVRSDRLTAFVTSEDVWRCTEMPDVMHPVLPWQGGLSGWCASTPAPSWLLQQAPFSLGAFWKPWGRR